MTGVFFDVGNITGFAEFNAYCDPFALQATLDLGIPVAIVPLDVCRKVQLSRERVANFQRVDGSPLGRLIATSHMHEMDMYCEQEGIDGCFPHDALTVLAAVAREYFYCVRGRVVVDGSANLRGRTTIILDDTSHVEVITGGNLKWCRERLDDLLLGRPATQSGQPPRPTARVAG
jgi:inosine-uridine nucleoside N-ribohydrolase